MVNTHGASGAAGHRDGRSQQAVVGADEHAFAVGDFDRDRLAAAADARDRPPPSTTPLGMYETHRASARLPARTSNGAMLWVRSIVLGVRSDVADDRLDDADELVDEAVVGQQRDGVVAAAHGRQPTDEGASS